VIPYFPPRSAAERASTQFAKPLGASSIDTGFTNPYAQQYNVSVEQELPGSAKLTLAYAGSKATHLAVVRELNPARFGPGATVANTDARRIYAPDFQAIGELNSASTSIYNSLQVSVNRRFAQGFTILANYVWAKSIDTTSINTPANSGFQNPFDL